MRTSAEYSRQDEANDLQQRGLAVVAGAKEAENNFFGNICRKRIAEALLEVANQALSAIAGLALGVVAHDSVKEPHELGARGVRAIAKVHELRDESPAARAVAVRPFGDQSVPSLQFRRYGCRSSVSLPGS